MVAAGCTPWPQLLCMELQCQYLLLYELGMTKLFLMAQTCACTEPRELAQKGDTTLSCQTSVAQALIVLASKPLCI